MPDLNDVMAEVRRMRDELMIQIYLGSEEAQEQWIALEKKWQTDLPPLKPVQIQR